MTAVGELVGDGGHPAVGAGVDEPAGPRRPAAGHRRGGARPERLLRAGVAPVPAAPAHRLDSRRRARPSTGPTTPNRLAGRRRRPLADPRCSATTRCRSACSATPRGRPEFLRDADGDELFFVHAGTGIAAHRVRPARLPRRRLPGRAPRHHLPVRAGRAHRRCWRSRRTGRASRCPTGGCSAATPCSTRRCIEVPEAEAVDEAGEFTVVVKRDGHDTRVHVPVPPVRRRRLEGRRRPDAAQRRRHPAGHVAPLPPAAVGPHDVRAPTGSSCARSRPGRWRRTPRRCGCRSSTATSTTTR